MTDSGFGKLQALSEFLKPIFRRWEKLRPVYNLILALVLFISHGLSMGLSFFYPLTLLIWLIGAVLANFCYLAGPLAEAYLAWVGLRSRWVTVTLFVGGVLISIPCVIFFVTPLLSMGVSL